MHPAKLLRPRPPRSKTFRVDQTGAEIVRRWADDFLSKIDNLATLQVKRVLGISVATGRKK